MRSGKFNRQNQVDAKPVRERLTLIRVFEALRGLGYEGGYDAVRPYARVQQRNQRAFAFFRGTCSCGIDDNASRALRVDMKTAVEAIFVGKERRYNRRFQRMCSHYLVEPVACTPASGWGSGEPWPKAAQVARTDWSRARSGWSWNASSPRSCG